MSQISLQDILGNIQKNHKEDFDKAREGVTPNGAWDSNLPLDREYRVRVDKAELKPSTSTGNIQIVMTWEVTEPAEFEGKKFQEYVNPSPTNEVGSRKLAELFGALQAQLEGWGDDFEGFVNQFNDRTAVVALRKWGQDDDRIGIRYVNTDRGQNLRTGIKPPKAKGPSTADLRPEIVIPKREEPFPDTSAATPPTPSPAPAPTPQASPPLPSGINLPPGLS